MANSKNVRSVARAINILFSFNRKHPSLDVSELQKLVPLARPTLYRLLITLENNGLVRSVGEPRRYEIGYRVVELANVWLAQAEIVRVAQPILQTLWLNSSETIALMIPLSPIKRLCAIELKSHEALSFAYGVGHTGVTYRGASGKVMLANMSPQNVDVALVEAAVTDGITKSKLRNDLERIKKGGYSVSVSEVTPGAVAIAAPAFDRAGAVVGAVALYGPEARLKKSTWRRHIDDIRKAAAEVSAALGYRMQQTNWRSGDRIGRRGLA